jgi:outer membrane protein assembly factor BamB
MRERTEKGVDVALIAVFCLLMLMAPLMNLGSAAQLSPWTMFKFNLNRTGSTTKWGPDTNTTAWTYTTGGGITSSPAVADGKVFIGSDDWNVYALDAVTGAKLWNYATGGVVYSSPAYDNGVVYVGSNDTKVYALDATTGAKLWSFPTFWGVWASPAVDNGVVYISGMDGLVYAINADTGTLKWMSPWLNVSMSTSPTVSGGLVYVGGLDAYYKGNVTALNATNGAIVWNYQLSYGPYFSTAAVVDGVLYIGTTGYTVLALNAATGAFKWIYVTGGMVNTSPAVSNGIVYAGSGDGFVYALNASSGLLIWKYNTGTGVYSSPIVAGNGAVYVGSDNQNMYALNAKTGAVIWTYATGGLLHGGSAVTDPGRMLYFGGRDGKVYAIGSPMVGGAQVPLNKLEIVAPWIALSSVIGAVSISAVVYFRRKKKV